MLRLHLGGSTAGRLPRRTGVLAAIVLAVSAAWLVPAQAATVTATPSPTWTVYKSCDPTTVSVDNCAQVRAILTVDSTVYVGGDFTNLINPSAGDCRNPSPSSCLPMSNLAAFDEASGNPVPGFLSHSYNGTVLALAAAATAGSPLYVGGSFTQIDGLAASALHLASVNALTGAKRSFPVKVSGTVRALLLHDSTLYVGGAFSTFMGAPRNQAAAVTMGSGAPVLNSDFLPPTLNVPDAKPDVRSFSLLGPRLYLAGHFESVGGAVHPSVVAVDPASGTVDDTFHAVIDEKTADSLQAGDQVVAVPDSAAGPAGVLLAQAGHLNRAYHFDPTGAVVWRMLQDGDAQAIAISGATVYVGGHFTCIINCYPQPPLPDNAVKRMHITAVGYCPPSGGCLATGPGGTPPQPVPDDSWKPSMSPKAQPYYYGVWALTVVPPDATGAGDLWVGGVFKSVDLGPKVTFAQPKLAVFRHL